MRETTMVHADPKDPVRGPWIRVMSGQRVYLADPQPAELHIGDVVWALGWVYRFGGHTREPYSVAQHSVHVLGIVEALFDTWIHDVDAEMRRRVFRTVLLHDATEAFLGDLVGPLKGLPQLAGYKEIEAQWWTCMAKKWDLLDPMPPLVKMADRAMLHAELAFLYGDELVADTTQSNALLATMEAKRQLKTVWTPEYARHRMNAKLVELGIGS